MLLTLFYRFTRRATPAVVYRLRGASGRAARVAASHRRLQGGVPTVAPATRPRCNVAGAGVIRAGVQSPTSIRGGVGHVGE